MTSSAEAIEQIRRTIARYCISCDDGRWDDFADLFTEDAQFVVMDTIYTGRDEIAGFMEASLPPDARGKHVTSSTLIELEREDRATGTTDYIFVGRGSGEKGTPRYKITNVGRYHDIFVREADGEWRYERHEIVFAAF